MSWGPEGSRHQEQPQQPHADKASLASAKAGCRLGLGETSATFVHLLMPGSPGKVCGVWGFCWPVESEA
jgi:hypothetical protein